MFILFISYFCISFDIVVANYTDDGSLELGTETSKFLMMWECLNNNLKMS